MTWHRACVEPCLPLDSAPENRFLQADTTLVIRCPYCLIGIEFRPMIAHKDGRFVCRDCAHTVRPGVPEYRCTYRPCLRGERGDQTEIAALLILPDC